MIGCIDATGPICRFLVQCGKPADKLAIGDWPWYEGRCDEHRFVSRLSWMAGPGEQACGALLTSSGFATCMSKLPCESHGGPESWSE